MDEAMKDYFRAHKQIEFDLRLPFATEKFTNLKKVLPPSKFIPVSEQIIEETDKREIYDIPNRSIAFNKLTQKMSAKLHQGNHDKLVALQALNSRTLKISSELCFFEKRYIKPVPLEIFLKLNKSKARDVLRDVRNGMFDSQCDI